MAKKTNNESDLEFLTSDLPQNKVSREIALKDLKRFLVDRNLLKKAIRKNEGQGDDKKDFEAAKDLFLQCIMDGTLVVSDSSPCTITHNLDTPPLDTNGDPIYESLQYGFVPEVIALRRLDGFGENESMARTQALLSAMTNKSIKQLGRVSSTDLDIVAAVAFFLI